MQYVYDIQMFRASDESTHVYKIMDVEGDGEAIAKALELYPDHVYLNIMGKVYKHDYKPC